MIGVFDSGAGGISAALELRRLMPRIDLVFLADRKNAPYGTKSKAELIGLISRGIGRLSRMGAERILMACCTASALWRELGASEQKIALPIIDLTAESLSHGARSVAVIATEYTVASGAFREAIGRVRPDVRVIEEPMQSLVSRVEVYHRKGNRESLEDQKGYHKSLEDMIKPELGRLDRLIETHSPDSLILGCTHFSWVESIVKMRYPTLTVLNPARLGAMRLSEEITDSRVGHGVTVYTQ